ncbi:hypothetical protein Btru_032663 [Bulinus truncatus]|nr:hypothetical protein Btru_032663 [Bulinus truncatus]
MLPLVSLLVCFSTLTLGQYDLKPYDQTATAAFTATDLNHDGHIDKSEMQDLFKLFDSNHDGRVSGDEFMQNVRNNQHDPHVNFVFWSLYNVYDVNNNNVVDHVDFDRLFSEIDKNGDNIINQQEYVQYFAHKFELMDKEI